MLDWQTYKALCDRPDVFSRWMLEAAIELVRDDRRRALLRTALATQPLAKPIDHRGGADTDMFSVAIEVDQLDLIVEDIRAAVTDDRRTTQTRTRGLGGFVAAWVELQRYASQRVRK